jgi:hypothetical protein
MLLPIAPSGAREHDLVAAKGPQGHHKIAAVPAFALTGSGTQQFTEDDIRRAHIRAGVRAPQGMVPQVSRAVFAS